MKLEELVGETLVIGVAGTSAGDNIVSHLRDLYAGGIILFRENFESSAQLVRFVAELELSVEKKLLFLVDHEGGRVIRFDQGASGFPSGLAFGKGGGRDELRIQGRIEGKELRRLGIDVNLAPVVDLVGDRYNPAIGIRSYGCHPQTVAALGSARIEGMQEEGLSACAKHFPGLGESSVDPHHGLPVIPLGWKQMQETHLVPFIKALESGVDLVMSSHALYPSLDPEPQTPATFSRALITGYLRKELGFDGVLASDDLEMGALDGLASTAEAAVKAAAAGHDLLLCCRRMDKQREVFHALLDAYRTKRLSIKELEKTIERIRALKKKRAERFINGPPRPEQEGAALSDRICRSAVSTTRNPGAMIPLRRETCKHQRIVTLFPRNPSHLSLSKAQECLDYFLRTLAPSGELLLVYSSQGKTAAWAAYIESAKAADIILYFCLDAHRYTQCRDLLAHLQKLGKPLVAILMENPWDEAFLDPQTACIHAYGSGPAEIRAVLRLLFA